MRFPPPTRLRRVVSFAFGLSLAATSLKLMACFINPGPTNPHEQPDGDPPDDPPDASDDADAAENPG